MYYIIQYIHLATVIYMIKDMPQTSPPDNAEEVFKDVEGEGGSLLGREDDIIDIYYRRHIRILVCR